MTHTDLQIGDYVYHKDKIVKVDILTPSDLNLAVADEDGSDDALYKDIKPIPITPEILAMNGFKYRIEDDLVFWVNDSRYIEYNSFNNSFIILGESSTFYGICNYVHELQHALRLCKIDKEVKL